MDIFRHMTNGVTCQYAWYIGGFYHLGYWR